MDLDPGLIIFIILFVVLPLIQRFLGGGKNEQRPPAPRPRPQMRQPQPPEGRRSLPGDAGRRERTLPQTQAPAREPETAADLIPADLWEILTGERRAPAPTPVPPRPSSPPRYEADVDEELDEDEEAVAVARVEDEEAAARELLRRRDAETARDRVAVREPVRIVSLETEPLPEPARHAAFHAQLQKPAAAAAASQARAHSVLESLGKRSDLMRGIVLQEVLGKPKGLE